VAHRLEVDPDWLIDKPGDPVRVATSLAVRAVVVIGYIPPSVLLALTPSRSPG